MSENEEGMNPDEIIRRRARQKAFDQRVRERGYHLPDGSVIYDPALLKAPKKEPRVTHHPQHSGRDE